VKLETKKPGKSPISWQAVGIAAFVFLFLGAAFLWMLVPLVGKLRRTAFGEVPTREELIGAYVAADSCGTETLVLQADGAYQQEFVLAKNGEHFTCSGSWHFDRARNELHINDALQGLRTPFTGMGIPMEPQEASMYMRLYPRRFGQEVRIPFDSDRGLAFVKTNKTTGGITEQANENATHRPQGDEDK